MVIKRKNIKTKTSQVYGSYITLGLYIDKNKQRFKFPK